MIAGVGLRAPMAAPLRVLPNGSRVLFGGNSTAKKQLGQVIDDCAYCDDPFSKGTPPTYDHLRPASAQGSNRAENGVLACRPCNNLRGNVPVVEFLEGEEGFYKFRKGGNAVERRTFSSTPRTQQEIDARKAAFSSYLKQFVENRIKAPASRPEPWFVQALDNLLYPVWKEGIRPQDPAIYADRFQRRMKALLKVLSDADSGFWLGAKFEQFVNTEFQNHPDHQKALVAAIDDLRQSQLTGEARSKVRPLFGGVNPFAQPAALKKAVNR